MQYRPVVDYVSLPAALDPLWTMIFTAVFLATIAATARRASYGIGALIATQPFLFAHYLGETTVTLPKVVLLGVLVGLGRQPEWRALLQDRRVRAVAIALAAYAAIVALSIAAAAHRIASVRETLKWVEYALLFWLVCVAFRRDRDDAMLARVWALTALAVAVLALGEEIIGAPSGLSMNGDIVPRIAGPLEGPNQLAAYLGIALPVLCVWCGRSRLASAVLVVGILTLGLTFSRSGIAAGAIAVGVTIAIDAPLRRRILALAAAGTALAAAGFGAWEGVTRLPGLLPQVPSAAYAGGVGYRGELWRAAIALFRSNPLLGVGAGNYQLELGRAGVFGVRTHANSWYLQSLAEGGILLFAATIGLALTVTASLAARLRAAPPWQLAAFAASIALFAHQLVDYLVFYPKVGATWWILVALGATSVRRR